MDQPFESDVMEDLAAESSISSADEFDSYEDMDQEGFEEDAFADGMDEFAEGDAAAFGDNLEGDLWDDYAESGDEFKEHGTNQRESNRQPHEQGQRRRRMDRGGEAGDRNRLPPRRRPPGYRGPWPPRGDSPSGNSFEDEFDGDGMEALSDGTNEFEDGFEADFGDRVCRR